MRRACVVLSVETADEASRIHHRSRRRGDRLTASGARPGRAHAAHRCAHGHCRERSRPAILRGRVHRSVAGTRLEQRAQHPHRVPLGRGRRRAHPRFRARTRRDAARSDRRPYHPGGRSAQGANPDDPHRLHASLRSGRQRLHRRLCQTRRQHHRLHQFGVFDELQTGGAAQGGRAHNHAGGGHVQPGHRARSRLVFPASG